MGCFLRKTEGLIGGATILLFNSKMQMKSGKQKLRLWQGKEADGSFPTSTPGKVFFCIISILDFHLEMLYFMPTTSSSVGSLA